MLQEICMYTYILYICTLIFAKASSVAPLCEVSELDLYTVSVVKGTKIDSCRYQSTFHSTGRCFAGEEILGSNRRFYMSRVALFWMLVDISLGNLALGG